MVLETRNNNSGYRQYKTGSDDSWKYTHRTVAEKKLGREIKPNEQVHHINKNKTDNRPANLVVLDKDIHNVVHKNQFTEKNACFRCGSTSHWAGDCYAKQDVLGRNIGATNYDSSSDSDSDDNYASSSDESYNSKYHGGWYSSESDSSNDGWG